MPDSVALRPVDAEALRRLVADAAANGRVIEARGGGSKRAIGAPSRGTTIVELGALRGIADYDPSELVLTARPATPLAEIEALLASQGQMLAFEPWDHGPLFGGQAGAATIGGVVVAGIAGPRRVSAGGARDHLLGFTAVSGRGEIFKGGGKVVKNVTGYDLAKVMAGSWGQLALLTELTLRVVPNPRTTRTVFVTGLTADAAVSAMARAMGSRCAVAAAAHRPAHAGKPAVTLFRLEGFAPSVEVRARQLGTVLEPFAGAAAVDDVTAERFWTDVREARPLATAETLWRVQVAPSRAAALARMLERQGGQWLADWAGALFWAGAPAGADIRAAAEAGGGHAMLVRGPIALRAVTPVRHPQPAALSALTARVKQAFDPAAVLDPHRLS